jgi:hypothetical protein
METQTLNVQLSSELVDSLQRAMREHNIDEVVVWDEYCEFDGKSMWLEQIEHATAKPTYYKTLDSDMFWNNPYTIVMGIAEEIQRKIDWNLIYMITFNRNGFTIEYTD